ncbi:galactonate dehydratase [Burkholderia diffusa]|uniref:Galactonate dehydratase n=1 Tax=Burkholderia diffusa TaxID=488732 RepID=A0AAW3P7P6_9BURK|nr:altronate dehydratase family protein [Burkholderia diffusa]KWF41465.1 galactonate dehydratase [Burkholderia diffusa]KWF44289.1 galactonate dehydratase [Burkholderia diffusa]KWF45198.1 galactonate dehydratase [Burkholderia diffusa]KWF51182.1 galactonate dehydratase [Burkholderia diffusa]
MTQPTVVILHRDDNVAVALDALEPGGSIDVNGTPLRVAAAVPAGHKIATAAIARGTSIVKCGQSIGIALRDIGAGEHVHVHNVGMPERHALDDGPAGSVHDAPPDRLDTFDGFVRPDGSVGTRNYIGVIASVNCSASVCHAIADAYRHGALDAFGHVDGVVAITHQSGCGMSATGEGIELLRRTLVGFARNPNFAGVLFVGLGCEVNQVRTLAAQLDASAAGTVRTLVIQDESGVRESVARGVSIVRELLEAAEGARRSAVPASRLTVGLQCGGSDGYSGITANPALGAAVDLLVRNGGTAILSETPEIYGAEHLLVARAASRDVAGRLLDRLQWWERYVADNGGEMNNNPSPGNIAGGITTILEKSLGAVSKGGRSALRAVYDYAEPVRQSGLVFMDTPGYDPVSATGQIAGGANLVCFTTGRGSVFGSKPVPTIKIATTTGLFERMRSDMDFDSGGILAGSLTVDEAGALLFRLMLDVASGRTSRSEENGIGEREFVPWQRGAIM